MTNNAWNTPNLTTNGQILIGSTGARPSATTITGDSDIAITNGAGSITVDNNATGGNLVKIGTATASSSASIEFTDLSSTYFLYILRYNDLLPATDATTLYFRTSTDNGSTFDSGASDYAWNALLISETGAPTGYDDIADGLIEIMGPAASSDEMGSGANETGSGVIYIYNPSAVKYTFINFLGNYINEASQGIKFNGGGYRQSAADVDAVQLLMDSGNIASGTFVLYGATNA